MLTPHNAPEGFEWILRCSDWSRCENTLALTLQTTSGASAVLIVSSVNDAVWRYSLLPPGVHEAPDTGMLLQPQPKAQPLHVRETHGVLQIQAKKSSLHIRLDPWSFTFYDGEEKETLRDNPADIDGLGRPFVLPFGFVRNGETMSSISQSFHLRQDEHLFGLGEKFTQLDKRGQKIISWTQDAFGSTSERSHKNIPFLWSTRGYGLFLNSGARIVWDLGTTSCQSYTVTVEETLWDAFLILAATPAEILRHYADLTGHAPMPPYWSFGLWLSSGGTYRDRASVEALAAGAAEHRIPADVIHIDPWWMHWRKYCDFVWNEDAFPDAKQFIESMHAQGYKICLWEHPYISIESSLFELGKENRFFVKHADGEPYVIHYGLSLAPRPDGIVRTAMEENSWNAKVAIIDLTNPAAVLWFQNLHRSLLQLGIDVFKTDFGEDIPADACFFNGKTGAVMHNLYPLLYNEAVSVVTKQEKGYSVVWGRAGTAGSQRHPICWSGDPAADFDSLACTIRGGLSIGMSGIPFWSNDIGGYRGMPSEQVYIRWAQFGLFCSHSRMHGDSAREPWAFSGDALAIVRKYIQLRYQLYPYLCGVAEQSCNSGMPVIRALPLEFPNDRNAFGNDLEFMLGPWLLVAPVYDEGMERSVHLPEGRWADYWSGTVYHGGIHIIRKAPLDVLPLFVRAGAIIPMMKPAMKIPVSPLGDLLIVDLFPCGKSSWSLAAADEKIGFALVEKKGTVSFISSGTEERNWEIRFRGVSAGRKVSVHRDGRKLPGKEFTVSKNRTSIIVRVAEGKRIVVEMK